MSLLHEAHLLLAAKIVDAFYADNATLKLRLVQSTFLGNVNPSWITIFPWNASWSEWPATYNYPPEVPANAWQVGVDSLGFAYAKFLAILEFGGDPGFGGFPANYPYLALTRTVPGGPNGETVIAVKQLDSNQVTWDFQVRKWWIFDLFSTSIPATPFG